jgi:hypothetical protein
MAHDFIDYKDKHARVDDLTLWTLRHFFIASAQMMNTRDSNRDRTSYQELCEFFESWKWLGPGVFSGTDLSVFVKDQEFRVKLLSQVFESAIETIKGFGEKIPMTYLDEHINTPLAYFTKEPNTQRFVDTIVHLQDILVNTSLP